MHIVVLCATRRGYRFIEHLLSIAPEHQFTIFSFRETAWEPPFFEDIRGLASRHNLAFFESRNLSHPKWDEFWTASQVDLILMVSWRYLVSSTVYERATRGAYVFHDSLLPKYRGFAPTVWAMINGESETGATLFKVVDEVDAGDIIDQQAVLIAATDTIDMVMEKVTQAYLDLTTRHFASLLDGTVQPGPQNHQEATFTCKWTPEEGLIHWRSSSQSIYNLIRASAYPYPGAYCYLEGRKLIIWSAELQPNPRRYVARVPGRVVEVYRDVGSVVLTGDSAILVKDVQLDGEERVNAAAVLKSPSQTLRDRNY